MDDWQPKGIFAEVKPALDFASKQTSATGIMHRIVKINNATFSVVEEEAYDLHERELRAIRGEAAPIPVSPTGLNESRLMNRRRFLPLGSGARMASSRVPQDEGEVNGEHDPDR